MMERSTTVNHRTTEDAKSHFNTACATLLASTMLEGVNFTKEDFFEALLMKASTITKKDIQKILSGEPVKK